MDNDHSADVVPRYKPHDKIQPQRVQPLNLAALLQAARGAVNPVFVFELTAKQAAVMGGLLR